MPQCPACESATLVVDSGSPYENGIGVFKCPGARIVNTPLINPMRGAAGEMHSMCEYAADSCACLYVCACVACYPPLGYWDAELRSQIVCVFSTHNKDAAKVERRPWTMQAVEEEEEVKPSPAEKIADDIKGKPPKEAAHLMMTLARENRLSLPTDDGQAIQNIGRFLMASKDGDGNWNAAEAYALLEKEYPTQVLSAAAYVNRSVAFVLTSSVVVDSIFLLAASCFVAPTHTCMANVARRSS